MMTGGEATAEGAMRLRHINFGRLTSLAVSSRRHQLFAGEAELVLAFTPTRCVVRRLGDQARPRRCRVLL